MAYIGQSIKNGTFVVLDTSGNTYNGSNVTFSLGTQVGSPAQLLVSHDGVIQKPGTDYSLATGGTQITFSTAPASGASIFIVEISGAVGGPLDSDLNGTELILDADGDTSITADTDDQIDIKIAGADDFQFTANTFTAASGSTIAGQAITATTVVGSGAAQFATAGIGAAKDLGVGLHIKTGDSGASVNTDAEELVIETSSGSGGMSILSATDGTGDIYFGDSGNNASGFIQYNHADNFMRFAVNGASEKMRINSDGDLLIGATSQTSSEVLHVTSTSDCAFFKTSAGGDEVLTLHRTNANGTFINFINSSASSCGSINNSSNGSVTTYATSSDYRLKENVDYTFDATTRLKQLKPARFNWIADDTNTLMDGFLAHEVSSVVPEAVVGTKDATETKQKVILDKDGKYLADEKEEADWIKGKEEGTYPSDSTWHATKVYPLHQGIDQAKLVPLLVKTVLELEARIATLEG